MFTDLPALARLVASGAPLPGLRAQTVTVRIDSDGSVHHQACSSAHLFGRYGTAGVDELVAAQLRVPEHGGRACCSPGDMDDAANQYVNLLAQAAQPLLRVLDELERGRLTLALVEFAGWQPSGLASWFTAPDRAWLDAVAERTTAALDTALASLLGADRVDRCAVLLGWLTEALTAAAALPGQPGGRRNGAGSRELTVLEALRAVLAGEPVPDGGTLPRPLVRQRVDPVWAAAALATVARLPFVEAAPVPGRRVVAFTTALGAVRVDDLAGLAVAVCRLCAQQVASSADGLTAVALVPATLATAAERLLAVTVPGRRFEFVPCWRAADLGPVLEGDGEQTWQVLLRLWHAAGDGPLADPAEALHAARGVLT